MKKYKVQVFLTIAFFAISSLHVFAGNVTIVGKVKNSNATSAVLFRNIGLIGYEEQKQQTAIDKKGNFKFEIDLKELTLYYLQIDEQRTTIYLQPGDNFTLEVHYSDFDNSLTYQGKGAAKNNLVNQLNVKFVYGHESDIYKQIAVRNANQFAYYCDSTLLVKSNFIDNFKYDQDGNAFSNYFKRDLQYENAASKLDYPGLWSYILKKGDTLPEIPNTYYGFLKEISFTNDTLALDQGYINFIRSLMGHYQSQLGKDTKEPLTHEDRVKLAQLILKKEKLVMSYEAYLIHNALKTEEFKLAEAYYKEFTTKYPSSIYQAELTDFYTKTKSVSPGQPAPDFNIVGLDGKKYSLNDFKGKVIYLDFWASWCGPCMRELPFAKKIKQEYEGKDILFLYISIDDDAAAWKKAVASKDIKGVHLNDPDFSGKVGKAYNLVGIPSYFLIDKNGKIISNNPPRPSSEEELKKVLNAALVN